MIGFSRTIIVLVLCAFSAAAAAQTRVADIVSQQEKIRAEVAAGEGRYQDMPTERRSELLARQASVLRTIEGKDTTAELNEPDRVRVFNDLEWIEAAINDAEDERMVCEYTRTVGSNRKTRVCKTVAQKRREEEEARSIMSRGSRCADAGCIGR